MSVNGDSTVFVDRDNGKVVNKGWRGQKEELDQVDSGQLLEGQGGRKRTSRKTGGEGIGLERECPGGLAEQRQEIWVGVEEEEFEEEEEDEAKPRTELSFDGKDFFVNKLAFEEPCEGRVSLRDLIPRYIDIAYLHIFFFF